ncbi:Spike glycoprotein, partial [Frankliniella fusca]
SFLTSRFVTEKLLKAHWLHQYVFNAIQDRERSERKKSGTSGQQRNFLLKTEEGARSVFQVPLQIWTLFLVLRGFPYILMIFLYGVNSDSMFRKSRKRNHLCSIGIDIIIDSSRFSGISLTTLSFACQTRRSVMQNLLLSVKPEQEQTTSAVAIPASRLRNKI